MTGKINFICSVFISEFNRPHPRTKISLKPAVCRSISALDWFVLIGADRRIFSHTKGRYGSYLCWSKDPSGGMGHLMPVLIKALVLITVPLLVTYMAPNAVRPERSQECSKIWFCICFINMKQMPKNNNFQSLSQTIQKSN